MVHLTHPDHKGFVVTPKDPHVRAPMLPIARRPSVLRPAVIRLQLVIGRERRGVSIRILPPARAGFVVP